MNGDPSMAGLVEGDIAMIETLRAKLASCSRAERRERIRGLGTPWLRMAVAMPVDR